MNDRELIRDLEGVHNKRYLALAVFALLVTALVTGVVIKGFRGNQVAKSADAITYVDQAKK